MQIHQTEHKQLDQIVCLEEICEKNVIHKCCIFYKNSYSLILLKSESQTLNHPNEP